MIGRKLTPRTLRKKLEVSPEFIEDARELVFSHETLSFAPVDYEITSLPKTVTYAELPLFINDELQGIEEVESCATFRNLELGTTFRNLELGESGVPEAAAPVRKKEIGKKTLLHTHKINIDDQHVN